MNTAYKWMGIILAAGVVLMFIEYRVASKKKEGFSPTDRKRVVGIFWLTVFFAALVGGLIWMTPD